MKLYTFCLFYFILLLISSASSPAEDKAEFDVLAAKGRIERKKQDNNKWYQVLTGNRIYSGDIIRISNDSYICIAHVSGRTMEIKNPGEYKAKDLSKLLSGNNTYSSRFTRYVLKEIKESVDVISNKDYRNNMTTTGATERSYSELTAITQNSPLNSYSPAKTCLIDTNLVFRWSKSHEINNYILMISDRYDRLIYSRKLKDTCISLMAYSIPVKQGEYYFWKVFSANDSSITSSPVCFILLTDDKINNIKDSLNILELEFGDKMSAIGRIIIAKFYEENDLLIDAERSYLEAIQIEPDVPEYHFIYKNFLERTGRIAVIR